MAETLERRVAKLDIRMSQMERQRRLARTVLAVSLVLLLVAAGLAFYAADAASQAHQRLNELQAASPAVTAGVSAGAEVVRARAFEVTDAQGRVVLRADADEHGGRLVIRGSDERTMFTVTTEPNSGGHLTLYGRTGEEAVIAGGDEGGGVIGIFNIQGRPLWSMP